MPLPTNSKVPPVQPSGEREITPVIRENDTAYIASKLLNQNNEASGSTLPPPQFGQYTIPYPTGFRIQSQTAAAIGNLFVLSWLNLPTELNIGGYRIYAKLALDENSEPTMVGQSAASPCYCTIQAPASSSQVTFTLQPYQLNGQTIPLEDCPTCTGTVPGSEYNFSGDDTLAGETADATIASTVEAQGSTAVGLGVTFPGGTPPYDTAYCSVFGLGTEAFYDDHFVLTQGSGITGGVTPGTTPILFNLSFINHGGSNQGGYLVLSDQTNSGGILGNGEHVILDGYDGTLTLNDGTDTVTFHGTVAGSAGASATLYLEIEANGNPYKIELLNPS